MLTGLLLILSLARAAIPPVSPIEADSRLVDQLANVREKIVFVEKDLIQVLRGKNETKDRIRKIRRLLELHNEERKIAEKRMKELEVVVVELERRKTEMESQLKGRETLIRRTLSEIAWSKQASVPALEEKEAPRREILRRLVQLSLREIEAYQIDLSDAEILEARIRSEREQLAYAFNDLNEQKDVLSLHKKMESESLSKRYKERLTQLEQYRDLKNSEKRLEDLLGQFNARVELDRLQRKEREMNRQLREEGFETKRGALPLPVDGTIAANFGKFFDERTKLNLFRKGIEIVTKSASPVAAVYAGKVVFAGPLNSYGQVVIVDHGMNYYTLSGGLNQVARKVGDIVRPGEKLGSATPERPVYFEIRSKSTPLDPTAWIARR